MQRQDDFRRELFAYMEWPSHQQSCDETLDKEGM